MTGVTVREWGAILMLRSLKSPESYFQAAFRVQSPWAYRDAEGSLEVRKPTCYVFEFDPNRALALVAEYGIRLGDRAATRPRARRSANCSTTCRSSASPAARCSSSTPSDVLDWATAGIGATALAQPLELAAAGRGQRAHPRAVLDHPDLLEALEQIEDFRALVNNAEQVVTSTKMLKKAKREQGGEARPASRRRQQTRDSRQRKEIREKLQKFLAKIPVFMYVTDFREEALKHVIESLDTGAVRAGHRSDDRGLPAAQQPRPVQRPAT